ncbi:hypothetical protein AIZ04_25485, partial [Salmonella enterica subsp. enterica serovar Typhimurium]
TRNKNRLCENLFPGAALTVNQYADIRLRDQARLNKQTQQQRATGTDSVAPAIVRLWSCLRQRFIYRFILLVSADLLRQKAEYS